MEEGGEYGELIAELTATLSKTRAVVNPAEQQELHVLLTATEMPTALADQLEVQV